MSSDRLHVKNLQLPRVEAPEAAPPENESPGESADMAADDEARQNWNVVGVDHLVAPRTRSMVNVYIEEAL